MTTDPRAACTHIGPLGASLRTRDGEFRCHACEGYVWTEDLIAAADRHSAIDDARPWSVLYDDYGRGTAFITDDPNDTQAPIAENLPYEIAKTIARAHNTVLGQEGEPGMCDCGVDMDAHCGGSVLYYHDRFMLERAGLMTSDELP